MSEILRSTPGTYLHKIDKVFKKKDELEKLEIKKLEITQEKYQLEDQLRNIITNEIYEIESTPNEKLPSLEKSITFVKTVGKIYDVAQEDPDEISHLGGATVIYPAEVTADSVNDLDSAAKNYSTEKDIIYYDEDNQPISARICFPSVINYGNTNIHPFLVYLPEKYSFRISSSYTLELEDKKAESKHNFENRASLFNLSDESRRRIAILDKIKNDEELQIIFRKIEEISQELVEMNRSGSEYTGLQHDLGKFVHTSPLNYEEIVNSDGTKFGLLKVIEEGKIRDGSDDEYTKAINLDNKDLYAKQYYLEKYLESLASKLSQADYNTLKNSLTLKNGEFILSFYPPKNLPQVTSSHKDLLSLKRQIEKYITKSEARKIRLSLDSEDQNYLNNIRLKGYKFKFIEKPKLERAGIFNDSYSYSGYLYPIPPRPRQISKPYQS